MLHMRMRIVLSIFSAAFFLLMLKFFYYQILIGGNLSKAATAQRITNYDINKPRGNILDRNLIPFTCRNVQSTVILKPLYLKENEEDLKNICSILGLDFNTMKNNIETEKQPILLETDGDRKNSVMKLNIAGVSSVNSLKRYDNNSLAKHIIGYLNKIDQIGDAGIEKIYDDALNIDNENTVGVITDAKNNLVQGLGYRIIRSDGDAGALHVKLTLDYHIQKIVEDVMDKNGITGAVVVEDVCTGDIIAMASKPDYDQNDVQKYLDSSQKELFNRATASYNLGSIFKIVDAALILESDIDPYEKFFCPGYIKVGNREFKCSSYDKGGHGEVNLAEAFAQSCNTYFINAGLKIGYANLLNMAKSFGLGSVTGINRQGIYEASGNLPDVDSYHSNGDIANISIGQGEIMATPLQVADLVATVANGGIKNTVNIVDSIIDNDGNKIRDLRNDKGVRVIPKDVADGIKELMEEVINTGTGMRASLDQFGGAGGKTGSAETSRKEIVHAWFAGYFPRVNPKYSISVFIENGQSGGKVAAPVFAEIASEIMSKGY